MKVLHIFKSEPDEIIKTFVKPYAHDDQVMKFELYKKDPDYDHLIKQIFRYDKVVCWW